VENDRIIAHEVLIYLNLLAVGVMDLLHNELLPHFVQDPEARECINTEWHVQCMPIIGKPNVINNNK
jgi:hypothetical protein